MMYVQIVTLEGCFHILLLCTHLKSEALFMQISCNTTTTKILYYAGFTFLHRTKQRGHHAAPVCDFLDGMPAFLKQKRRNM